MANVGGTLRWKDLRTYWPMYLFVLPTVATIALFQYYPAASGVFHSLFRWNGADVREYVGFGNYLGLMKNADFWNSFELAFMFGVWNIVKMAPALLVAICVHRVQNKNVQFLYRVLFVIQMVIPGLVLVLVWRSFFFEATSGYLNRFLLASGVFDILAWLDRLLDWGGLFVAGRSPAWLGDPRLIVVACVVWGFPWIGSFAVLNYLAKLESVPKDIYEAADVDGATWWSKFTAIEFPLIMSSIKVVLVLVIIGTIKDAGMVLALAGLAGGPGGAATVPALFMLRKAFIDQDLGCACAIGIVLTLIVLALQKGSELLTQWETLSPRRRAGARWSCLVVGLGLLAIGRFKTVGFALVLAAFPYSALFASFRTLSAAFAGKKTAAPENRRKTPEELAWERLTNQTLRVIKHLVILLTLALAFIPLYLMAIVSLKTNDQFYFAPASVTRPFHWENWRVAWDMVVPCVANSVVIAFSATALSIALALSAAYFFARYKMPLSGFLWNAVLVLMMMPAISNLIPLFRLLGDLRMLNTLTALIVVGASAAQIFALFVLRSFVEDIPKDLFEAAEIDGAGHLRQLIMIVLPLSGPILGAVAVMTFIGEWNDFVLPLIVIRDHSRLPVMVQLLRMAGEYIKLWGPLMAGYAMASVPVIVLFVFSMRLFSRGLTEGGVKG